MESSETSIILYAMTNAMAHHGVVYPKSVLASPGGLTASAKWQKLSVRVREHEKFKSHNECYIAGRELKRHIVYKKWVYSILEARYHFYAVKWCNVLKRIIDVVLFVRERGLALNGSSHGIGDPNNGNSLGVNELLSRWDHILQEHVQNVKEYQEKCEHHQVHYLSPESKNEFISVCSNLLKQHILLERRISKYFAVIVDATPDDSHDEKTTFLLKHVNLKDDRYEVQELFLMFADCSSKREEEIAQLTLDTLEKHANPLRNCMAQAYDNAANSRKVQRRSSKNRRT